MKLTGWIGLILGAAWLCCGCSQPQPSMAGRWVDQKSDTFLEFTPSGLCAEVSKGPVQVLLHHYAVKEDMLVLEALACGWNFRKPKENVWPGATRRYGFSMNETEMRLQDGKTTRRLKRIPPSTDSFRLQGLWRAVRPDHRIDYYEMTPWGDMIALLWFPPEAPEETWRNNLCTPLRLAEWHSCRYESEMFSGNGFSLVPARRSFLNKVERGDAMLKVMSRDKKYLILSKADRFE